MTGSLKETVAYYESLRDTVFEFVESEYQAWGIKLKKKLLFVMPKRLVLGHKEKN